MHITPVVVLAGAAGASAAVEADAATLRVIDADSPQASPDCICCAISDGLTRAVREAHFARSEGHGRDFTRVLVDSTGQDPRPAIAALSRAPLASLRFALSAVVALDDGAATDPFHAALADRVVDAGSVDVDGLFSEGLYPHGALDAAGWLERGSPDRLFVQQEEPSEAADVELLVQAIQLEAGAALLRLKGLVHVRAEPGPRLVQAFGHTRYPSAKLAAWPGAQRNTRVAIALAPLEKPRIARILDLFPFRQRLP